MNLNRFLVSFPVVLLLSFTWSKIAISEEAKASGGPLLGDGSVVKLEDFAIQSVKGWAISKDRSGMALSLEEVKDKTQAPVYDKPIYLRNITVTRIGKASPMDAERLVEFKEEMTKRFTKDMGVQDFQITEAKLNKLHKDNDSILVFNQFKMGQFPMMQVHLLVSNDKKQYLVSYTDLADRFNAKDGMYSAAWASISSIDVGTDAPERPDYRLLIVGIAAILGLVFLIRSFFLIRARKKFLETSEVLFNDHDEVSEIAHEISTFGTIVNGWNLKGSAKTSH